MEINIYTSALEYKKGKHVQISGNYIEPGWTSDSQRPLHCTIGQPTGFHSKGTQHNEKARDKDSGRVGLGILYYFIYGQFTKETKRNKKKRLCLCYLNLKFDEFQGLVQEKGRTQTF